MHILLCTSLRTDLLYSDSRVLNVRSRSGTHKRHANDVQRPHNVEVTRRRDGSGSPNGATYRTWSDSRRSLSDRRHRRRHRRQCVSVLTGHPRVDGRLEYVVRLLRQLRRQIVIDDRTPDDNAASLIDGDDECQNPTDVYVYCDGDCGDALRSEFINDRWIEFRELSNSGVATADQTLTPATIKIRSRG